MSNLLTKNKLRNCPVCGKLFTDMGLGICPSCYDKRREEENLILDYVRSHPKSTIQQICDEIDADYDLVLEMVQRGQFITTGGHVTYPCSTCGKPIMHGMYCPRCLSRLEKEVQDANERRNLKRYPTAPAPAGKTSSHVKSTEPDSTSKKKIHLHWIPGVERDL